MMTEMSRTIALTATLAAGALAAPSIAHASTTKSVGDLSITADWSRVASYRHEATGDVSIGPVSLTAAEIYIDQRSAHRTVTATGDLDVELFDDCWLNAPGASVGYAVGADIKANVGEDAPVQDDESYLYVAADNNTSLHCLGFEVELGGGQGGALYINPNDPSLFVRATGLTESLAQLSPATQQLLDAARFQIHDAWFGVSAEGLVPWAADYRIGGRTPEMDAHVVIGGTVEITTSVGPIEVENGTIALRLNNHGLEQLGVSGAVAMPVFGSPLGNVELPLAEGALEMVGNAHQLDFEVTAGGSPFDELGVPGVVHDLLDTVTAQQAVTVGGHLNLRSMHDWEVSVASSGQMGPFEVDDARITVSPYMLAVSGDVSYGFAGMNLAGGRISGQVLNPDFFIFSVTGEMGLGIAGADMDLSMTLAPWGLSGRGEARLWGNNVDGSISFGPGYHFASLDLTKKVNFWFGKVKLKVKVRTSGVSVKADCNVAGYKFNVGVSSNGCFRAKGMSLCF